MLRKYSSKKRRTTTKKGRSRSRSIRRPTNASLWRGALRQNTTYKFVRNVGLGTITTALIPVPGGRGFALNDLPNYTEYTAIFDAYRLVKVELTLYPSLIGEQGAHGYNQINLYTVVDPDDANATAIDAMRQYANFRVTRSINVYRQTIYPKVATLVYNGVVNAYGQPSGSQWIDCANADVVHYGWKYTYDAPTATNNWAWRMEARYFLEFKGPH